MIGSLSTALSGLAANQARVDAAAQNIANAETRGYKKQVVTFQEGPSGGVVARTGQAASPPPPTADEGLPPSDVDLTEEIPSLNLSKGLYQANLAVVRTQDEMLGVLLDRRN